MTLCAPILILIAAYLLGSVPFAVVITRWIGGLDIREVGSGNVGATNVYRAMGFRWAFAAFLGDALKGFLPVLIMWLFMIIKGLILTDSHRIVLEEKFLV